MTYKERLRQLGWFSLEQEAKGQSNSSLQLFRRKLQRQWSRTSVVPDDKTRGNSHKLQPGRLQLEIRRNFFTLRVLQHWNKLSRDKGESSSLEAFKAWPEKPAAVLTHISCSPVPGRRLEQITSRDLFQCTFFWFCESMFCSESMLDLLGSSFYISFRGFIQKKN